MRGRIEVFDDGAGLGAVQGDDGSSYPFHCTQIAGGTRTIEPGTVVEFTVMPGHLGRWEATDLRPLPC